jgi:hypothetical protein
MAALKPDQAKRLQQIGIQVLGPEAFSREDVKSALKLTDAQMKTIKGSMEDSQKEIEQAFKDAQGDFQKMGDAFRKMQESRTATMDKAAKSFDADQKKMWNELTGEKFELRFGPPGRPGQ